MEHIGSQIERIERNMKLNTIDPVALHGFTQIPNFILRDPNISIGAKTIYSLLLSHAWHNDFVFLVRIVSPRMSPWGSRASTASSKN